jgi:hypothetical protein
LVVFESAIDALHHASRFLDERTRYARIGGEESPCNPSSYGRWGRMPLNSKAVAAMDADEDGRNLAEAVRQVA